MRSERAAWRLRGTMTDRLDPPGFAPTGQPIELTGVDMWRLRDGQGCRLRVYTDVNAVARQIGAVPPGQCRRAPGPAAAAAGRGQNAPPGRPAGHQGWWR
jgi:hypothetical protein